MKRSKLENMSIEQLLERYTEIGIAQYIALLDDDAGRFNRLFDRMTETEKVLRERGRTARLQLLTLYDHPNAQVRLNAIKETLAVAPKQARQELEELADSFDFPQAGDAGMTLDALEDGSFKPT